MEGMNMTANRDTFETEDEFWASELQRSQDQDKFVLDNGLTCDSVDDTDGDRSDVDPEDPSDMDPDIGEDDPAEPTQTD